MSLKPEPMRLLYGLFDFMPGGVCDGDGLGESRSGSTRAIISNHLAFLRPY